jgi:hypothetical protein
MRYTLDPMKQEQVCSFIRAGGVGWVAAEAVGIPRTVFRLWLERGAKSPREPYAGLYLAVMQAEAQSRLKAEIEVRQNQPLQWLKYGPGKALPGQPGWTGESSREVTSSTRSAGTSGSRRATLSTTSGRAPASGRSCLGRRLVETGQNREPTPPASTTAQRIRTPRERRRLALPCLPAP